jgi:hypothetical protein
MKSKISKKDAKAVRLAESVLEVGVGGEVDIQDDFVGVVIGVQLVLVI